jgi:hypothetical protein
MRPTPFSALPFQIVVRFGRMTASQGWDDNLFQQGQLPLNLLSPSRIDDL